MQNEQISIQEEPYTTTIRLHRSIFDKEALIAAAYNISNKYNININENDLHYTVEMTAKSDAVIQRHNNEIQIFIDDVLDHQLRLQLYRKTAKLRDIIVEHAFKPIDDLRKKISEFTP